MHICPAQLKHWIIRNTLQLLDDYSPSIENLLLGTLLQESQLTNQWGRCNRFGLYQISSHAHRRVWDEYLINHPALASTIRGLAGQHSFLHSPDRELIGNLPYATAIAWMIYRPHVDIRNPLSINQMATIWKRHFHPDRSGKKSVFISDLRQCLESNVAAA